MDFLCILISIYLVICIARVILSFIQVDETSILGSIGTLAYTLTEPVFAPVRRALPTPGDLPLDFSPMVVTFVLVFLRSIVC